MAHAVLAISAIMRRSSNGSAAVSLRVPRWGEVSRTLLERAFDGAAPPMVWTGDGVRRDRAGRLQSVKHAVEDSGEPLEDAIVADVPKLLLLHVLREQSHDDLRAWIAERSIDVLPSAQIGVLLETAQGALRTGERLVIAYAPHAQRTRILWPWGVTCDVAEPAFMRSLWRWCFGGSDQPELRTQLLRWIPRRA